MWYRTSPIKNHYINKYIKKGDSQIFCCKYFIFWFSVYKCWKHTGKLLLHKYFYAHIFGLNIYGKDLHSDQKYAF